MSAILSNRWLVLATASILVPFAGCLDPLEPAAADDEDPVRVQSQSQGAAKAGQEAPLPSPLQESQAVTAGLDVFNFVEGEPCAHDLSDCFVYPIVVTREQAAAPAPLLDLTLSWSIEANDFDLYLYRGNTEVESSAFEAPGLSESFQIQLKEGNYEVWVSVWAAAADEFTLSGTWSRAAAPVSA